MRCFFDAYRVGGPHRGLHSVDFVSPLFDGNEIASRLAETLVGFLGGVTGGLTGASSVIPAIWCATRGWEKEQQRATLQPFIMAMQAFSLFALAYYGRVDRTVGFNFALFVIPVLVGVGLGVACFKRMSNAAATRAVMWITGITGIAFLAM